MPARSRATWVGYGKWKAMPAPKSVKAIAPEKVDEDIAGRQAGSASQAAYGGDGKRVWVRVRKRIGFRIWGRKLDNILKRAGGDDDPDRPKLHKKTSDSGSTRFQDGREAPRLPPIGRCATKSCEKQARFAVPPMRPDHPEAQAEPASDIGNVDSVADSSIRTGPG